MKFKEFLMTESNQYFANKLSNILNALQDLNDTSDDIGAKHLVSNAQTIVNQLRRIIHTQWKQSEMPYVKTLQKCGVAIMKAIEEKNDLKGVLKACQSHIESIVNKQDTPLNNVENE